MTNKKENRKKKDQIDTKSLPLQFKLSANTDSSKHCPSVRPSQRFGWSTTSPTSFTMRHPSSLVVAAGWVLLASTPQHQASAHQHHGSHHHHHHHQNGGPSALSSLLQVHHVGNALQSTSTFQLPVTQNATAPVSMACEPFAISSVHLAEGSRFAIAQRRNHEFLLSLDIARLACDFTSAANLTECKVGVSPHDDRTNEKNKTRHTSSVGTRKTWS